MRTSELLLALAAAVPAMAADIVIETPGQAVIDSAATRPVEATAKSLIVSRLGADGRQVAVGEPLIEFDPSLVDEQLDDRRRAAAIAALDFARWRAGRDAELAALESERRLMRADLAAVRAAIAVQEQTDPDRIALLDAERRQAELRAELAARDAARQAVEHDRGQISSSALSTARDEARRSVLAVEEPTLAWRLAAHPLREPVDLALARVKASGLAIRLGLGPDGAENPALGIGARIAAARVQLEADAAARKSDLDRATADLRQAEREARDRTPLAWVEVRPAGGGEPVARFRFQPAGHQAPPGWSIDTGAAFTPAAGHGWDRQLDADNLVWREGDAPAESPRGPPQGGPRSGPRGGGPPGGGGRRRGGGGRPGGAPPAAFTGGTAVVAGTATWSLAIPDGTYQVTFGLGDDRDWDGPALRAEGVPAGLPPRIPAGISERSLTVAVADGRLDLQVGDGIVKAVRAESAGVIIHQPNVRPGFRVDDPSWAMAFLADRSSFVVDGLVAQELAPLLAPGRKPGGGDLADRLVLAGVELVRTDGTRLPAEIVSVGAQSVRWLRGPRSWGGSNPADDLARELRLRPASTARGRLVLGESLSISIRIVAPAGSTALPPHLVRIDRDGALIRVDGRQRPVKAVRIGSSVVVDAEVDPARCTPPGERDEVAAEIAAGRFRGGVAPGSRTRVAIGWVWGRVESMVADGSLVEPGQIVLSVYNPQMEADQERTERERRAAVQNVIAAAERRRQGLLSVRNEHASRVAAETEARMRLRRHLDDDPVAALQAAIGAQQAAAGIATAAAASGRLAQLSSPRSDDVASAAAAAAKASIAADRAALDAARQQAAADWIDGQDLAAAWSERLQTLSRREEEIAESALQERINTLADRIAMERAVEGNWWQRNFAMRRQVKAPVAGRILFLTGWNDQAQRSEKIGPEFPVWGGMTVAEIVDERTLGFTAELPDDRFPRLAVGQRCELELAGAPGRSIPATLTEIGRAFTLPRDALGGGDGSDAITSRRVFQVTAAFTPPDDLRGSITTGAKGWLRIP